MNKLYTSILVFLAALLAPAMAFAAQVAADTDITILQPEIFQAGSIAGVAAAIAAVLFELITKFMGPFGAMAKIARLDQMLESYIRGGLTKLVEKNPTLATRGITVDVNNQFIAALANDVIKVAPGWMIRFAGGAEEIKAKIRNRLPKILQDLKLPPLPVPG